MTGASTNKAGISIIIPIYNEAERLPNFISLLFGALESHQHQIIFVDGGSQDGSCKIIQASPNCSLLKSKKGRALQMNAGAKNAIHKLLYFIHVDCTPPQGFDQILLNECNAENKAGCFQLQFDHDHFALNWVALATKYNTRFCRSGDQSLFVEKQLFMQFKGFNEHYTVCEDVELIDRLYKAKLYRITSENNNICKKIYRKWHLAITLSPWLNSSNAVCRDRSKETLSLLFAICKIRAKNFFR